MLQNHENFHVFQLFTADVFLIKSCTYTRGKQSAGCLCFAQAESCLVLSFLCCWGTVWWHHHAFVHQYSWKGAKKLWWIHSVQEDDVNQHQHDRILTLNISHNHQAFSVFFVKGRQHGQKIHANLGEVYDVSESSNFQAGGVGGATDLTKRWNGKNQRGEVYAIAYWVDYVHIFPIDYGCSKFSASFFCSKNHLQ